MRFALLTFVLLATPVWAIPARAGDIAAGQAIARKCESCHAVGATGESPRPPAPAFRDLSRRYPLENLQEALAEGIVVGHDATMPEFKLSPAEIDDFLAYLESIQTHRRQ